MKARRALAALTLALSMGCGDDVRVQYTTTNDLLRQGVRDAYEKDDSLSWRKDREGSWYIDTWGQWESFDLRDYRGNIVGDSRPGPNMKISIRDYEPWHYADPSIGFSWPLEMGEEDVIEIMVGKTVNRGLPYGCEDWERVSWRTPRDCTEQVERDTIQCLFRGPRLVPIMPEEEVWVGLDFLEILPPKYRPERNDPAAYFSVCSALKEEVTDHLAQKFSRQK